jgi:protein-tyrosine phosphatase
MTCTETKPNILFVCTGNTCRSPMAAAFFNHMNPDSGYTAHSAGIAADAGRPASAQAVAVLKELYGLDLSGHRARGVTAVLLEKASLVLTMTTRQRQTLHQAVPDLAGKIMTLAEAAGLDDRDVQDPFGCDEGRYQQTASELAELIRLFSGRLAENDDCRQKTNP